MRVAIVQSNYIPWKGYFDLINMADHFVLYDEVQFTRRDWRNRNTIKTASGPLWLTIPVEVKGRFHQSIAETRVADSSWAETHWKSIRHAYAKAPGFGERQASLAALYEEVSELELLSEINARMLSAICGMLGVGTPMTGSSLYPGAGEKSERLLQICLALGATTYLSGPAARAYLDVELFAEAGVAVEWMDYSGYCTYPQLLGTFEHSVSIVDPLLCLGDRARFALKSTGTLPWMLGRPPGEETAEPCPSTDSRT